ncbi:hypothetical protein [Lysobacter niastensis]|uniref:Uncharacterized protein n=1 Tax=Lysobacter niastensis TaxID=380629 RepID=A0ABS0B1Y2_9GAMM|nr:hypothetical protein [Lysobacter niastensis]MBF6022489.1 hypothetical protein [Lysobacter niastensis]
MPNAVQSVTLFLGIAFGALLLGAMFAWLWWRYRGTVLFTAALFWLGYAIWEIIVQWRTPEADVRVDLVVIYPALLLITTFAMLALRRRERKKS